MKLRLLILFFFILSFAKAQRVPDTEVFHLWNITDVIYGDHNSGRNLRDSFTASNPSYFNSTYAALYAANSMLRFRDYGVDPAPPTYEWSVKYRGSDLITTDGTTVKECDWVVFTVVTTNVPDGTVFSLFNVSGNYSYHYKFDGAPAGQNWVQTTISGNTASATVRFPVDRTIEADGSISFQFRREDISSENVTRSFILKDHIPAYLRSLCGQWGPYGNTTLTNSRVTGDCSGLKLIKKIRLYVNTDGVSSHLIKIWDYTEIDTTANSVNLDYTLYADQYSPIQDGYKYTYTLSTEDIYGNYASIPQEIACNVYKNFRLREYQLYVYNLEWKAKLGMEVTTNIQYEQSGTVHASDNILYEYGSGYTYAVSDHDFTINSPQNAVRWERVFSDDIWGTHQIEHMVGNPIYFTAVGDLFRTICGEQINWTFTDGQTPPIFINP